jgi:NAD(P)-dependent dehydrogenase (short-subunit alcohol dehydrogenase family)
MHQGRHEAMKLTPAKAVFWATALGATAILLRSSQRSRYSFRGKSVFITGGSRGLGLEIARILAREGALLTIVGRNQTTLEAAQLELEIYGNEVLAIPCDVRDPNKVQAAVNEVIDRRGRIDVLINNAGVIEVGPFQQMTRADYQNAMATHLWGSLNTIRSVVPYMRQNQSGRIVNISSIGGKVGVPHLLPYAISKFALAGLSQCLAAELARDRIRMTAVYPGLMRTGSHVNARFRGNYRGEYAWFSIAAGMPIVSINSQRAASQIIEACRNGKSELIITPAAKLAALINAIAPSLVTRSLQLTNAMLPAPNTDASQHSGWESTSIWSPSPLTRLADQATARNNQDGLSEELPNAYSQ